MNKGARNAERCPNPESLFLVSWFPDSFVFLHNKKPCAGKRMAEKSYFLPRSLRRNYPHQVQGVRPGRLSRVGSPAVVRERLKEEGGRRKWKFRVRGGVKCCRASVSDASRPSAFHRNALQVHGCSRDR